MRPLILLAFATLLAAPLRAEEGSFELYELRHRIGVERWVETDDGDARIVSATTSFDDRRQPVDLVCALRVTDQGGSLRTEGTISRFTRADRHVETKDGAFPILGFAPFAAQRELVRAWKKRGCPTTMKGANDATLTFQRQGHDQVSIDIGRSLRVHELDRWSLSGLVWGEETLYLDGDELVAVVGWDAESDRFTALRAHLAPALADLEDRADKDQLRRFPAAPRPKSGALAIVGGDVLVGDHVEKKGVVVIEGDKIVAVGPKATTTVPEHAQTLDATGKTVLPGLWDMHAHYEQVDWGPVYMAAGVTTVRDCGDELSYLRRVRAAIQEGTLEGPRMLVAGLVDATENAWGTNRADTPEQARALVTKLSAMGCEQVKVYDSVSLPVLKALASAAHARDMTVTGHVPLAMGALEAVEAGLDQISHCICVHELRGATEEDAIAAYKKHGTVVDPTLAIYELVFKPLRKPIAKLEPGFAKLPRLVAQNLEGMGMEEDGGRWASELAWIKKLHEARIPIVAGSDQTVPGHSLHRELELYVEKCGFTPIEAIQAATSVPARVMKLDDAGVLAAGKRADVVIIDGDPLEKISDIRKVWKTIAAGRVYEPGDEWERVGFRR